ncbi:PHP domain-containing protein [candidate division KSB1 bacterium]|nr:PHP domain-containing protein [candidate division KSB1 bacterium]
MTEEVWADLHLHSYCSDGLLSPEKVIEKAHEMGLKAVALVDHDALSGIEEAIECAKKYDIDVIPGVELSSQARGRDIHILGYYFDVTDKKLLEYLQLFQDERKRRAARIVQKLNDMGVYIHLEDVEAKARGCSIGRPHIAEVLMDRGYVETFQEAFRRYIGYGGKAYVDKYKISPQEAIGIISNSKGLSFLAHPGPIMSDVIILELIKAGLDGLEVVHPNINPTRTQELQDIVREHGLLISGGSDCHGGRDGHFLMGKYSVPYSICEDMKSVLETRWGKTPEFSRKEGGFEAL